MLENKACHLWLFVVSPRFKCEVFQLSCSTSLLVMSQYRLYFHDNIIAFNECLSFASVCAFFSYFFVCFFKRIFQDCPINAVDFRELQCEAFNNRTFRGRYYKWKPFAASMCISVITTLIKRTLWLVPSHHDRNLYITIIIVYRRNRYCNSRLHVTFISLLTIN